MPAAPSVGAAGTATTTAGQQHGRHDNGRIDHSLRTRVGQLRERGMTWELIGAALGMTRQSAWERFSGER